MRGERGPEANYREMVRWVMTLSLCAALVYGATIWLIFWLMD